MYDHSICHSLIKNWAYLQPNTTFLGYKYDIGRQIVRRTEQITQLGKFAREGHQVTLKIIALFCHCISNRWYMHVLGVHVYLSDVRHYCQDILQSKSLKGLPTPPDQLVDIWVCLFGSLCRACGYMSVLVWTPLSILWEYECACLEPHIEFVGIWVCLFGALYPSCGYMSVLVWNHISSLWVYECACLDPTVQLVYGQHQMGLILEVVMRAWICIHDTCTVWTRTFRCNSCTLSTLTLSTLYGRGLIQTLNDFYAQRRWGRTWA